MGVRLGALRLAVSVTLVVVLVQGTPASAVPERILHASVSVSKSGSGSGRVVSRGTVDPNESAIDCGSTCSGSFVDVTDPAYTPATLTATPDPGSTFDGWGGACSGSGGCTIDPVERLASYSVTATFSIIPASSYPLAVSRSGEGTVTSAPSGIDCGSSCSASFDTGSTVTLSATPAAGWTFGGWSGACSGTGGCSVGINGPKSVNATFSPPPPPRYSLTVARSGNGRVTSSPGSIDCGTACETSFDSGTAVTLTAEPSAGSEFRGWGGACSGTAVTCTVRMDGTRGVTASFGGATSHPIATTLAGQGRVESTPVGIACGSTCSASFPVNGRVTLNATPAPGWVFVGWSGSCTGSERACALTLSAPATVLATFAEAPAGLPLAVTTSGRGRVTSVPAGIACGTTCSSSLAPGTVVTLTAVPATGWTLAAWVGDCTGKRPTCRLTLDGSRTVTAQFARLSDRTPPRVRALASSGRRGTAVRLRYRLTEAGGKSREWAVVTRERRTLGIVRGPLDAVDPEALYYVLLWRAPRSTAPGAYRFCVHAVDAAGNRSGPSCAALRVTR